MRIGSLKLANPVLQASLSGYSDRPMRVLARQYGASLTFTGVLLDKNLLHRQAVKNMALEVKDDQRPVGAQILGADPVKMAKAAQALQQLGYDLIDLNFACPAPKVLRRQRGGFLLQRPQIVSEIYNRVRDAVTCPVLMKLRAGFDSSEASREDFLKICQNACDAGVSGLIIHGRTVMQRYHGQADWRIISSIKQTFPATVIIGSGDIFEAETAIERLKESGSDGIVIARGAIGNPWIFGRIAALYEGKAVPDQPTVAEQGKVMLMHFNMIAEILPEMKAVRQFRKFCTGYCKHHRQRKKVLMAFMAAKTAGQVRKILSDFYGVTAETRA